MYWFHMINRFGKVTFFHAHSSCSICLEYKVVLFINIVSDKQPWFLGRSDLYCIYQEWGQADQGGLSCPPPGIFDILQIFYIILKGNIKFKDFNHNFIRAT